MQLPHYAVPAYKYWDWNTTLKLNIGSEEYDWTLMINRGWIASEMAVTSKGIRNVDCQSTATVSVQNNQVLRRWKKGPKIDTLPEGVNSAGLPHGMRNGGFPAALKNQVACIHHQLYNLRVKVKAAVFYSVSSNSNILCSNNALYSAMVVKWWW